VSKARSPTNTPSSSSAGAPSPPRVRLELLGGFGLSVDSEPLTLPMNAERLISYLALQDRPQLRAHVAGTLWGEGSQAHAGGSLRSALWRLGHPAYPLMRTTGAHVQLSPFVTVDLRERTALAQRVLDESTELSEADLDEELLSVDLLPDWTEEWVLVRREQYHQLRLRALESLCSRLTAMGRFGQAVQAGLAAVSGEPLRESARRALVSAHLAEGNVGAATREFEAFRRLLKQELNIEPSREMKALLADRIR
jgi:DNA-binding SARP family transcriptional activator